MKKMGIETSYEETTRDDEITIDLIGLLLRVKKFWWLIVIGIMIGLGTSWLYTEKCVTPMYSASSMVYLRGSSTDPTASFQDIQVSTALTKDYELIFRSRPIMEQVIKDLNLPMTYKQLAVRVEIANPNDTRILKVSIKDRNPELAKKIVNQVVIHGMDSAKEIDQKDPYLIEEAVKDLDKVSPNMKMNMMIGAMAGCILMLGFIFIQYLLNDHIVTSEDVEKYLDLPVLCEIVESKSCNYDRKKRREHYGFRK